MPLMGEAIPEIEERTEMEELKVCASYDGKKDIYKLKIGDRSEFF